jgi:hypothetical protein
MIVWEDSSVPRTLKSLIFFDCGSPPLGTIPNAPNNIFNELDG